MIGQIIACTFATAGIILFAWCLIGAFLLPVAGPDMVTEYRVRGDAPELEQRVRSFGWLRETGLIEMQLRIVDCGLSAEARQRAQRLIEDHTYIELSNEMHEQ